MKGPRRSVDRRCKLKVGLDRGLGRQTLKSPSKHTVFAGIIGPGARGLAKG